jgi:ADP-ribose pyrophosphatase
MPSTTLLETRKFRVEERIEILPDGSRRARAIVVHPGAAVVLPLLEDDEQRVLLIRNHRIAAGGPLWELPAGTLEPGETPERCAARELVEETGHHARCLRPLLSLFSSPGFCDEKLHVFVATGLHRAEQALSEGERIEVHPLPMQEALAMVRDGRIEDAKTIAALLYHACFTPPDRPRSGDRG